jgi:hypothetical protein
LCHSGCPLLVLDGAGGNMVTWGSGNWTRCVVSADVEMLIGDSLSLRCACLPAWTIASQGLGLDPEVNRNAFGCSAVRIALSAFTRCSCLRPCAVVSILQY